MPATNSPAIIVARFLKANNYNETYDAFTSEAGLPVDAGTVNKGDLTLETLLEEKRTFDLSQQYEKIGIEDGDSGWTEPAPSISEEVKIIPSNSNLLSVAICEIKHDIEASQTQQVTLVSTADRYLHILDDRTNSVLSSHLGLHDSPILCATFLRGCHLLTSSMSGQLLVSDLQGRPICKRRDHSKYVVQIAIHEDKTAPLIATAGWDCKINIYRPAFVSDDPALVMEGPTASITLPSKPESIVFVRHPDRSEPLLLVSRTDSSFLFYYTTEREPRLIGKQNLAPHSNAWVAFTPSALALHPSDPSLLAVGTSTVPHMRLLIVRLLFPPYVSETPLQPLPERVRSSLLDDGPATLTQASQARAALAVADRESAAIQIHCNTMAPQTAYSTPAIVWRPDGSGVWVNGDDGMVRGVEASTGKVVATLKGHDVGTKVRCLWGGSIESDGGRQEVLISGGFDHRLIVWRVEP